jgi:hypothetical protein
MTRIHAFAPFSLRLEAPYPTTQNGLMPASGFWLFVAALQPKPIETALECSWCILPAMRWMFVLLLLLLSSGLATGADDIIAQHHRMMLVAVRSGDIATAKKLLRTPYIDINDDRDSSNGLPYLGVAVAAGQDDMVEFLITSGASLTWLGELNGATIVHCALFNRRVSTTQIVVNHLKKLVGTQGFNLEYWLNASSPSKLYAPIFYAVGNHDDANALELTKILHEAGANLNLCNSANQSPLNVSEQNSLTETSQYIKSKGGLHCKDINR